MTDTAKLKVNGVEYTQQHLKEQFELATKFFQENENKQIYLIPNRGEKRFYNFFKVNNKIFFIPHSASISDNFISNEKFRNVQVLVLEQEMLKIAFSITFEKNKSTKDILRMIQEKEEAQAKKRVGSKVEIQAASPTVPPMTAPSSSPTAATTAPITVKANTKEYSKAAPKPVARPDKESERKTTAAQTPTPVKLRTTRTQPPIAPRATGSSPGTASTKTQRVDLRTRSTSTTSTPITNKPTRLPAPPKTQVTHVKQSVTPGPSKTSVPESRKPTRSTFGAHSKSLSGIPKPKQKTVPVSGSKTSSKSTTIGNAPILFKKPSFTIDSSSGPTGAGKQALPVPNTTSVSPTSAPSTVKAKQPEAGKIEPSKALELGIEKGTYEWLESCYVRLLQAQSEPQSPKIPLVFTQQITDRSLYRAGTLINLINSDLDLKRKLEIIVEDINHIIKTEKLPREVNSEIEKIVDKLIAEMQLKFKPDQKPGAKKYP